MIGPRFCPPALAFAVAVAALLAVARPCPAFAADSCSALREPLATARANWDFLSILDFNNQTSLVRVVRASFDHQMDLAGALVKDCSDRRFVGTYHDLELRRMAYDINTFRTPFTVEAVEQADHQLQVLRDDRYYETADGLDFFLLQHVVAQYYACMHKPFTNYVAPPNNVPILRDKLKYPCQVRAGTLKPV